MDDGTKYHTLKDGRVLAYKAYGQAGGHPVFYAHGGPGSRLEGSIFDEKAAEYGFRLIATDRPGMGRSTFQPGRVFLDYPKDIAELADALDINKFGVLGWSGGGAHTTVCGYAMADRLSFNISLAGYTNFAELPGAAEMLTTSADRMAVKLYEKFPRIFGLFFVLMAWTIKAVPGLYYKSLADLGNETDKAITAEAAFKNAFIADQKEAFRQGGKGVSLDSAVHYMDWGFRLKEIPGQVHVFQGTEDPNVPIQFAQHLGENIPNCQVHWLEGEGHLFPWNRQDEIFSVARDEV